MRVFKSSPAATSLNFIGGPSILLGLIAMASDDHTMYAAVKVLNSILNSSPMSEKLMRHIGGYQVGALLSILDIVFPLEDIILKHVNGNEYTDYQP